jgi:FMN phosphatase YigB (HAD superfamily)
MLKALFLDMDDTLCDTNAANVQAKKLMADNIGHMFGAHVPSANVADAYVLGIYREWNAAQKMRYSMIIQNESEEAFRVLLIRDLLAEAGIKNVSEKAAKTLQDTFDRDRLIAFNFYPGITEFLAEARKVVTLVVITNGPAYSQISKTEAVCLKDHVDHIIIGGLEPEQKPARSIFQKALKLANCSAHEACHVGDSLSTDVTGAHNSGIKSLWVQHQQQLDEALDIKPNHTVLHPGGIQAVIRKLCMQRC